MTQFAMVEELAFLIKDNLTSKHLILSVEEALVDFLQNDTSPDAILELKPMSPYNRLLLHRLADIFGFAHESVGEGDDRHLILERCPESSIPSILVSDILWQYDEYQSPTTTSHQILRRQEALPALKKNQDSLHSSLEEREAAYLAARERIFSVDDSEIKESVTPTPRNIPVVARRMIAHALGQRIHSGSPNEKATLPPSKEDEELRNTEKKEDHLNPSLRISQETTLISGQKVSSSSSASPSEGKVHKKPTNNRSANSGGTRGRVVSKDNLKQEHMGAAKRIFAHALGLQGAKEINNSLSLKCNEAKTTDKE